MSTVTKCEYGCGGTVSHNGPCVMNVVRRDTVEQLLSRIWNCVEHNEVGEAWLDNLKATAHAKKFLTVAFQAGADAARRECAEQVPTNWLDSLLTGPDGMGDPPWTCPDISRLLLALRERILSRVGQPVSLDTEKLKD